MLIVITSEKNRENEIEELNSLFELGLETLHLRKPASTKDELESLLKGIAPAHKRKVVLHQHHELAGKYNIKGLHLREENRNSLSTEELKKLKADLRKKNMTISSSFHAVDKMKQYDGMFDYVFLSPVFDSISKEGYTSLLECRVREVAFIKTKIIALGGIKEATIDTAKEYGFDGVAVLGALWQDEVLSLSTFEAIKKQYLRSFVVSST